MKDDDLRGHVPGESARRRALAAGLDLDRLRKEDPDTYRMMNAFPVAHVDPRLLPAAEAELARALPGKRLFGAAHGDWRLVLAFPAPTAEDLAAVDDALASTARRYARVLAYSRRVHDRAGERRELAIPLLPSEWSGAAGMVGPFEDEAQARAWASENVMGKVDLTYDTVPLHGVWFCDVFHGGFD